MQLNLPSALVAGCVILALAGVNVACLVTHQPAEILAAVGGGASALGVLAAALMGELLKAGPK